VTGRQIDRLTPFDNKYDTYAKQCTSNEMWFNLFLLEDTNLD